MTHLINIRCWKALQGQAQIPQPHSGNDELIRMPSALLIPSAHICRDGLGDMALKPGLQHQLPNGHESRTSVWLSLPLQTAGVMALEARSINAAAPLVFLGQDMVYVCMGSTYSVPSCIDGAALHVLLRTSPGVRAQGIQFSVVITEGRPDETGLTMAQALDNMRVPTIAILDSAVAYALEAFRCALPAQAGHSRTSVCSLLWACKRWDIS